MCVILHCEKTAPSKTILEQCERANRDGGGIAWRRGRVNAYKKGLTAAEIHEMIQSIELPYVIHFRIGTVGDDVKDLCHPFEITPESENKLENSTENNLLFHNGHIHEHEILSKILKIKLSGHVSDSRILASLMGKMGAHIIRHFKSGNKFVLFGRKIVRVGDWKKSEGIYYSNLNWKPFVYTPATNYEYYNRGNSPGYVNIGDKILSREEYRKHLQEKYGLNLQP